MKPYLAGVAHTTAREVSDLLEQARKKLLYLLGVASAEGDNNMDGCGRLVVNALNSTEGAELWLRDVYDATHPTNVELGLNKDETRAQLLGTRS